MHLVISASYGNYNFLEPQERKTQVVVRLYEGVACTTASVLLDGPDRTGEFRSPLLDLYDGAYEALTDYLDEGWIGSTADQARALLEKLRENEAEIRCGCYRVQLEQAEKRCAELRQSLELWEQELKQTG